MIWVMIDKNSSVPIYFQLKNSLKEKIIGKVYLPGGLLPSEKELAQRFSISRMTVRQAIQALQSEGLVYKEKGRGTFVARNIIEKNAELQSFTQDMISRGFAPGSRTVHFGEIAPDRNVQAKLELAPGDRVYFLKRLRLADSAPMAVEYCYLPCKLFPGLPKYNLETCSLYEIIKNDYHYKFGYSKQLVSAVRLAREDAGLLLLKGLGFSLQSARILFADSNMPLEYTETLYHPERYQYTMILQPT